MIRAIGWALIRLGHWMRGERIEYAPEPPAHFGGTIDAETFEHIQEAMRNEHIARVTATWH